MTNITNVINKFLVLFVFIFSTLSFSILSGFTLFPTLIKSANAELPEECLNGQDQANQIIENVKNSNASRVVINSQKEAYNSLGDVFQSCPLAEQLSIYKILNSRLKEEFEILALNAANDCIQNKMVSRGFDIVNLALWKNHLGMPISDSKTVAEKIKNCLNFKIVFESDLLMLADTESGSHYTHRSYSMKSEGNFYGEVKDLMFVITGPSTLEYQKYEMVVPKCNVSKSTVNGQINYLSMDFPAEEITTNEDLIAALNITFNITPPVEKLTVTCPMVPEFSYEESTWYVMFQMFQQNSTVNEFKKGENNVFAKYSKINSFPGNDHEREIINISIFHTPVTTVSR
ncbi:MAG: hypothetical protein HQK49_17610 [Oligoflexia bacterium]|nr:hypothetical protein [Oligoflexia bacterium]